MVNLSDEKICFYCTKVKNESCFSNSLPGFLNGKRWTRILKFDKPVDLPATSVECLSDYSPYVYSEKRDS